MLFIFSLLSIFVAILYNGQSSNGQPFCTATPQKNVFLILSSGYQKSVLLLSCPLHKEIEIALSLCGPFTTLHIGNLLFLEPLNMNLKHYRQETH